MNTHSVDRPDDAYGFETLLRYLWRRRWFMVFGGLGLAVAVIVWTFTVAPIFQANVTVLPEEQETFGGVMGGFAGLSNLLPQRGAGREDQYREIVRSNTVLDQALARRWRHASHADSVTLAEIFGAAAGDAAAYRLKRKLRSDVIGFSRDGDTGLMTLSVRVPEDPVFAADFANYLAEQLERFNQRAHRREYGAKRAYIEKRLEVVHGQLEEASSALTRFENANRGYGSSPELRRQHTELERELQAVNAIWVELRRQLEIARIEEYRETIGITVLDAATPPAVRVWPMRSMMAIVATVLGSLLGLAVAVALDVRQRIRDGQA